MNGLMFVLSLIFCMSALVFLYKSFGENGVVGWIAFASVFANIEILKTVECFGLNTTLGNTLFGTIFLATDILSEVYGKKSAKRAVFIGLTVNIAFVVLSQIDLLFIPSSTDFAQPGFELLFSLTPRVCLGSVCAYAFGNLMDVLLYDKFKQAHGNKLLWVRNNVCTLISQFFDNFILHSIAFSGFMSFKDIAVLSVNVWIIEVIVALFDTPFLYFAKYKINRLSEKTE